MITALISSLFVGLMIGGAAGGAQNIMNTTLDQWEKGIKKYVDDDNRKDEALADIEQSRKDIIKYDIPVSEKLTIYYKDDNDYKATLAQYKADLAEVNKKWKQVDGWMLNARFKMKELLTPEEFKLVVARVQDKSAGFQKDMLKNIAKSEKKLNKKIAKYNKKYGKKYERPVSLKEIAPELLDSAVTPKENEDQ